MKIYVITTGNKDRLESVSQQLHDVDYELIYSDSYEQLKEKNEKISKRQKRYHFRQLSVGEYGAFSTHAKAWKKAVAAGEPCLILEDNVMLNKPLSEFSADIYSYGLVSFAEPNIREETTDRHCAKWFLPLYCYGITPFTASMLIEKIDKYGYLMPVDKWMTIPRLCGTQSFNCRSDEIIASRRPRQIQNSIANKESKDIKRCKNIFNKLIRKINGKKYNYSVSKKYKW